MLDYLQMGFTLNRKVTKHNNKGEKRVFLSSTILVFLPILCKILTANYCSNRKMLKFNKEITILKC